MGAVARIVLNTFGSLGDVHPYLALALELRKRGHDAVIATSEVYRDKVQDDGIGFVPVRPDVGQLLGNAAFLEKLWHPRLGTEYLMRKYLIPSVEQSYEDLSAACRGADLILTHTAAYAGPIVAEVLRVPWISVALQPIVFLSSYDPPVLAPVPWFRHLQRLGRFPFRLLMAVAELRMKRWAEPVQRLRERVGLERAAMNPITRGQFSPLGTLALFSRHFAPPQPDWPLKTRVNGFAFYDRQGRVPGAAPQRDAEENGLARFLAQGSPPVLFTLGSSAVMRPGNFFRQSIEAARSLKIRAVLLVGSLDREQLGAPLPESIYVASYLPYSEIMPRSAAIVHQGGIGTTAQALRAGRPMLVVPWAHDQPDNADRIRRLVCWQDYFAPKLRRGSCRTRTARAVE